MAYGFVNAPGVTGPELAAVKAIAESALDKANDAIESSGSSKCVIKITFDEAFAGAQYTVTDGNDDTQTGTVPDSLVDSVSVKNCNTQYTITASADGVEYSNTVTTGAYFGQYTATLSVFTATIVVTAVAGAVVTATYSSSSYSATADSSGKASIVVKKSGTYTITGTISGVDSNSTSVSATTDGGSYTATIAFITLVLTSPSGSAITVTKNSTSLTGTSTGSNTFYLPSTGTWTVTISLDGETASDTVSATAYQTYTLDLAYVHIYGASWDGSSTTSWTRTDEAAGFTDPVPATSASATGSSPFDDLQPWAGMVKSERTGGTMVSIPKFWYKLTQNGTGMTIQIADKAVDGYSVSPAHMDRGDGAGERDVVYIARYHCGSSAYKSVTGQTPKVSITRSTARSSISALGSDIWQMDFAMRFTIWLLYLVEFANWNTQATIGGGCSQTTSSSSAVFANGVTDGMVYHTGNVQGSHSAYGACQYRWIEGLWDNCLDWLDGCYYSSSGMSIILNPSNFSDSSGGTVIGTPSNGWPSAFTVKSVSGTFPTFIATTANGSATTYSCDGWYFSASYPCLYCGGYYYQNTNFGLFYIYYYTSSGTGTGIGCRLQELPS